MKRRVPLVVGRALILLALPSLVVALGLQLQAASGPYFVVSDPSYAYLTNSLLLATGHPPVLIEHPGTPLQALGALVLRVRHLGSSEPLAQEVLREPESAIRAIHLVLLGGFLLSLFVSGLTALVVFRSLTAALIVQAAPLLSLNLLRAQVGLRPEALELTLGQVVVVGLLLRLMASSKPRLWGAVVLGVGVGTLLATKIVALPLVLLPILVPGTRRERLLGLGAMGASFGLTTLPAWSGLDRFLAFIWNVSAHKGPYGFGAEGFVDPFAWARMIGVFFRLEPLYACVLLGGLLILLRCRLRRQSSILEGHLRALVVVNLVQIALIAKHQTIHHLVPAQALLGLMLLSAATLWDSPAGDPRKGKPTHVLLLGLLAASIGLFLRPGPFAPLGGYAYQAREIREISRQRQALDARVAQLADGRPVVQYLGSSAQAYALEFADMYSDRRFNAIVCQLPDRAKRLLVYDLLSRRYISPCGPDRRPPMSMRPHLLRGYRLAGAFREQTPPGVVLKELLSVSGESVYAAVPSDVRTPHR